MIRFFPLLLCVALAACTAPKPLHGAAFERPPIAKRFTLTTQDGSSYVLPQTGAQATALYFGFTHCKDICPQTLAKLGKARSLAGLDAQQLAIVMVTVDPAHDSAAAFRSFFGKTGVQAIGLTGTKPQLAAVYHAYGVAVQPQKDDIGHTDYVYLLDKEGRLREILASETTANAIADDLRATVK